MKSSLFILGILLSGVLIAQPEETDQQKSMARQMAKYMDMAWEAEPESGMANLRLLFIKDGKPYSGIISIHGRFDFILQGKRTYSTSVNPNENGRYVYESIEPGSYKLMLTGRHEMEGFSYTQGDLVLKDGEKPLVKIQLLE